MYRLQTKDLAKASDTLAEAFDSYPLFEYIIPDPTYRKNHLKYLCHFLLRLGLFKGEVVAPSDTIEGVSIWLPPAGTQNSGIDAIRAGLLNLFFHINMRTFIRFVKIGDIKDKKRTAVIKSPYYLCDMIGVNPLFQKRGFGRKMIEAKLIDCDNSKLPCYLETSKVGNIDYYKKFGFNVLNEYNISDTNVYCLLRKPKISKLLEK